MRFLKTPRVCARVCVCAFHRVLKLIIDLNEDVSEIIHESTDQSFPFTHTKTNLGHYSHSGQFTCFPLEDRLGFEHYSTLLVPMPPTYQYFPITHCFRVFV